MRLDINRAGGVKMVAVNFTREELNRRFVFTNGKVIRAEQAVGFRIIWLYRQQRFQIITHGHTPWRTRAIIETRAAKKRMRHIGWTGDFDRLIKFADRIATPQPLVTKRKIHPRLGAIRRQIPGLIECRFSLVERLWLIC